MTHLHFHPDLSIERVETKGIHFEKGENEFFLPTSSPSIAKCIEAIQGGVTEDALYSIWTEGKEETAETAPFFYFLFSLKKKNLLSFRKGALFLIPKREWNPNQREVEAGEKIQISRFAFFRRKENQWIAESPVSAVEIRFEDPKVWKILILIHLRRTFNLSKAI